MKESLYLNALRESSLGRTQRLSIKELFTNWAAPKVFSVRDELPKGNYSRELVRAGITLPPLIYVGLCVCIGALLTLLSLSIGPLFAITLGGSISFELIVTIPRDWATRRERDVARQLPLCAEGLGQRIRIGIPFETALVQTSQSLPKGILTTELNRMIHALQRGTSPARAVHELYQRLRGPEVRAFAVALKMYCLSGQQLGEPLIRLAGFLRRHREATDGIARRVGILRQIFGIIFSGMSLSAAFLVRFLPPEIVYSHDGIAPLVREIGGIMIVGSLVLVMRLSSARAWEIGDDG